MFPRMADDGKVELQDLRDWIEDLDGYVEQAARSGTSAHEVEKGIWDRVFAVGRAALNQFFTVQGDGDLGPTFELPDGRELNRLDQSHERRYRSIFGTFTLERAVYGSRESQKIELVPLDQRLQLPESEYSYLLQDWCQSLGVEHAFRGVSRTLERILGQRVPVDSLERMSRQMSSAVDGFRQSQPTPPAQEEGSILVVSADNKGVPMRRPDDERSTGGRRGKGEKANKKQMATMGCAYTVDPKVRTPGEVVEALFREAPGKPRDSPEATAQHKRVCARLTRGEDRGQDEVFAWLADQVSDRAKNPEQEIPCLMDGEGSLWKDRSRYLSGSNGEVDLGNHRFVEILDLLHATSKVWEAAHLFHAEGSTVADTFARERILRILEGKVGYVIGGLRQMATKRMLRGPKLKKLRGICNYLEANRHRMRYDAYLAKGYPIATGVIEGACRYVVKDRMERAGMRWTVEGAQAMLDLRTTYVNDQWDAFQEYRIDRERWRLYPHQEALNSVGWPFAA